MIETFFQQFWHLIAAVLTLNPEIYTQLAESNYSRTIALLIVLAAGLSQAIGQSFVLFVNRVQRVRFFLSLGVAAFLFAFAYIFWAGSIWLVGHFMFRAQLQLPSVMNWVALSYAPQLFGFLVALPYLGIPFSVVISIWSLLSLVTGLQNLGSLSFWMAVACAGLGWVVLQLLQRTAGRPLIAIGQSLKNRFAGKKLVIERESLAEMIRAGNLQSAPSMEWDWVNAAGTQLRSKSTRRILKFLAIAAIALVVVVMGSILMSAQGWLTVLYEAMSKTVRLTLNLVVISLIALVISIVLTPLETLSWWAGWQEPGPLNPGTPVRSPLPDTEIARYVIYLDGINQGAYACLPEVDRFLDELVVALPPNVLVVKGIMPYSVTNRPISQTNPSGFLWRIVESLTEKNPNNPIGFLINLRNVFAVAVSADSRYGLLKNQGLAQVLLNSLVHYGYPMGSQPPITLIGNSGGGQMAMGAVTYLREVIPTSIEVISISGVIAGNTGVMETDHLYHLVGSQDLVEKIGPICFPSRWALALSSSWNRAKRRGKISIIPLGSVGHNGQSGPLGANAYLEDGRSHLQQTLNLVTGILLKDWALSGLNPGNFMRVSNYEKYQGAPFNRPEYYPIRQSLASELYYPTHPWLGRMILPTLAERHQGQGVRLEVYHAPQGYEALIGRVVNLRWREDPAVQSYVQLVTYDIHFEAQVQLSQGQGYIHPERLNHWHNVDPLESLAGAHPRDDIVVALKEPVAVLADKGEEPTLLIHCDPLQISGRYYGLVTIRKPLGEDRFRVQHYCQASQGFDGAFSVVYIPRVIANRDGIFPSSKEQIEQSPANASGWYIFGAQNVDGEFVVQALAPYRLFALQPDRVIRGKKATLRYINFDYWKNVVAQKGKLTTALLLPNAEERATASQPSQEDWQEAVSQIFPEGTRTLLVHVYGGIGGEKREAAAVTPIFFGHFSYGIACVIREPLTDQLRFQIEYRQIYTHNIDGIVAGANCWTRYIGDRQFGWLGTRPISEIAIAFPPLTEDYNFDGVTFSPFQYLIRELDVMAARYRVGDGTGTTMVSPVNSCVQDSSQALYSALKRMIAEVQLNPFILKWLREHPHHEQTHRFQLLSDLVSSLEANLVPFGLVRRDWKYGDLTLGRFPGETPGKTMINALASWRTLLPRLANDIIAMIFLQLGATLWVIRTNQIGGYDRDIEPIAPTDFGFRIPRIVSRSMFR